MAHTNSFRAENVNVDIKLKQILSMPNTLALTNKTTKNKAKQFTNFEKFV